MKKINKDNQEAKSLDLIDENIKKLKDLFPDIMADFKIDFNLLREILGDEIEENDEYYRFTWNGKKSAIREAHKPSTGTDRKSVV